jgi:hypothetical protein
VTAPSRGTPSSYSAISLSVADQGRLFTSAPGICRAPSRIVPVPVLQIVTQRGCNDVIRKVVQMHVGIPTGLEQVVAISVPESCYPLVAPSAPNELRPPSARIAFLNFPPLRSHDSRWWTKRNRLLWHGVQGNAEPASRFSLRIRRLQRSRFFAVGSSFRAGRLWGPTRQGIAGRKLIKTMGPEAEPNTASLPTGNREYIGLIDLPMPQKTHNGWFRLPRPFGAAAGGSGCCCSGRGIRPALRRSFSR